MKLSYRIAELEKAVEAFRQRAFTAESERDELRAQFDKLAEAIGWSKAQCEQTGNSPFDVAEALISSKEENTQRDAAASEPVAWISERNLAALGKQFSVRVKHEPVMVRPIALYTAAPAHRQPLLPPAYEQTEDFGDYHLGWNSAIKAAIELGAQPQMVVELPAPRKYDSSASAIDNIRDGEFNRALYACEQALDTANVKYEVKK